MMDLRHLDREPVLVAIAGPNGAGKTTFYETQLRRTGLRFVNADVLAREFETDPYNAAKLADQLRIELAKRRESFVFETVFSDPVGDKLTFLKQAAASGYTVVLCFIGLKSASLSSDRVAMRVSQGGHDVPEDKLEARFPRILNNLQAAIRELPHVEIFDNSVSTRPFQRVCIFEQGQLIVAEETVPEWLRPLLD